MSEDRGRDVLNYIKLLVSDLEKLTDSELDSVVDGLTRVKDDLQDGVDYFATGD